MPQVMLARVTCPKCHNPLQIPVEQILDVRADPGAKVRVLNGLVNVAACPHCGTSVAFNLPFLYHDPDKELALVYMPMEAGRTDLERQQAIGKLTNAVMDSLPPEERKAYLLQPQIIFTLEKLTNKILEADGVTPEMIEQQKARVKLLQRMLDVTSDEALEAMIKENDASIDDGFFQLLGLNLEMAQAAGQAAGVQQILALQNKLLELSSEGQMVKARTEMLEALRAQPTRERLLDLLIQAPDEPTRGLLVTFGRPLLDYPFFQALTTRIESAPDKAQEERLRGLRKEILDIRDRLDEATRALYESRAGLLRDLLLSDDPETLARRRFPELDETFLNMLATNLEEARAAGNEQTVQALQSIWGLVLRLTEETIPPELRLVNQLVAAEGDAEVERLLQENRDLVTESLVQFMENVEAKMRDGDALEAAERMASVLEKARGMVAEVATV